ncbi:hypothetical protein AXF42_Ash012201 [Apostasia shenzhenica]|uniref:Uncharacterized protein n=1 Tax=Apostasia shenzhenica TaxID=1088818 RepID=A0A2I0B496_9ASPA|nr:hypothetical protein AXF42_Ash012201 [Apostasia shenzhenica]
MEYPLCRNSLTLPFESTSTEAILSIDFDLCNKCWSAIKSKERVWRKLAKNEKEESRFNRNFDFLRYMNFIQDEKKGLQGDTSSLSRKPFRDASNIQNKSGKKVKVGFSNKESYRNRVRRKYVRNQADQTINSHNPIKAWHRGNVNHHMKINSDNQKQNYSMLRRKRKVQFHS